MRPGATDPGVAMRVVTTATEINNELIRLIRECSSCQIAVAWATIGFEVFDLLVKQHKKIGRMVVGTHFYQTHPDFIEAFMEHRNVRFVLKPDGVFHPKTYLFEKAGGEWECLIGSPNLTQGGVGNNDEMAVLVTSQDQGASSALKEIRDAIEGYWLRATVLGQDELVAYREAWQRKQPVLKNVLGRFGKPKEDENDGGKSPLNVPILRMSWAVFFKAVRAEKDHPPHDHSMEGRLGVIRAAKQLFENKEHFKDIGLLGRQQIAGLTTEGGVHFLWFGSMRGAGKFWTAINDNDRNLSLALDLIPATGDISREAYLGYVECYRKAFPEGRDGIATATRLLAMKRPDTFVCLNKRNREGLCDAFGISRNVGYEEYWDSIIERVKDSATVWWSSPRPTAGEESEVWDARAAFLDSLYYDGKDMPAS